MGRIALICSLLAFSFLATGCAAVDDFMNKGPDPVKTVAQPLVKYVKQEESRKFCALLTANYRNTFRYRNTERIYKCNLKSLPKTVIAGWKDKRLFHIKPVKSDDKYVAKVRLDFGTADMADSAYLITMTRPPLPEDAPWRVSNIQTIEGVQFGIG